MTRPRDRKLGGLSQQVADWVVEAPYSDIPPETVEFTKGLLLKTVASMVSGSEEPLGRTVLEHARASGGVPEVGVVSGNFRSNVETASFANGVLAHATEMEDAYFFPNREAVATCWIFPAILSLAEKLHSSGEEVIAAAVFSFEIASRLARAAPGMAFSLGINTATWFGVPAAAAAASRLLKMNPEQTRNAMAIAASQSAGLGRQIGTDAHTLESGHSCRAGVSSALLARAGATGVPDVLEGGPLLYGPVWESGTVDLHTISDGLGAPPFDIVKVEFKKYPGCGYLHAPVDALVMLLEQEGVAFDEVEVVEIEVGIVAAKFCDRVFPETMAAARFSLSFALAEVLLRGRLDCSSFRDEKKLFDARFRDAQRRVKLIASHDPAVNPEGCRVAVVKKNGQRFDRELVAFRGHPDNPLTLEETKRVLRPLFEPVIEEDRRIPIENMVLGLEGLQDIRPLMELLTFPRGREQV
ncbi:MAG: MmgE/PrpD family protein [Deltaproteobacteria bacterium]|nr:MmgE/PrpD family protein [Deltaproteobacteria bacterium]MBW2361843.1 MmgE/PrpD family protein [Deltaproteobacteria bacterium]